MRNKSYVLKEWCYFYGFKIGITLIILPILTDLLMSGAREWNVVSIGIKGVLLQIVGLILMFVGGRNAK